MENFHIGNIPILLGREKKLQFASQHCARAHTLGQDSIFCPIIEFRSKCEFLPFFQLLRNFGVEIRILCVKIQIFYFLKASFLVRKFKLVIGSPIFEPKKDFCPSVCAWLCPFFARLILIRENIKNFNFAF